MSLDLYLIQQEHDKGCAVCFYTREGPCTVAALIAEVRKLRGNLGELEDELQVETNARRKLARKAVSDELLRMYAEHPCCADLEMKHSIEVDDG